MPDAVTLPRGGGGSASRRASSVVLVIATIAAICYFERPTGESRCSTQNARSAENVYRARLLPLRIDVSGVIHDLRASILMFWRRSFFYGGSMGGARRFCTPPTGGTA
jgi:hypothetical protein